MAEKNLNIYDWNKQLEQSHNWQDFQKQLTSNSNIKSEERKATV